MLRMMLLRYEKIAFDESVSVCRTPLVKDCDIQGPEVCRTEYESECWTKQEVHDVEDDVVSCTTEVEEKCEDETSGYTTNTKCSKWPKEVCSVEKKAVKKYTPITGCTKEPREICAPAGCGPRRFAVLRRRLSRNTHPSPVAPRNPGRSVLQLAVASRRELRNAMTRPKQLFRMPLRNSVPLNHRGPASM